MRKKYVFILIICLLVAGCGNKNNENDQISELSQYKNSFLKDISNYTYTVTYNTKINDEDTTIRLDCQNDLVTKVEHCNISGLYYNSEKYSDYNNKFILYRDIYSDEDEIEWEHLNRYYNNNPNSWYNVIDLIENIDKEEKEDGTYYTGTINDTLHLAILLQEADGKMDPWTAYKDVDSVPITVLIDKNGYIKEINTSFKKNEKINLTFSDFNETPKQEMPSNY